MFGLTLFFTSHNNKLFFLLHLLFSHLIKHHWTGLVFEQSQGVVIFCAWTLCYGGPGRAKSGWLQFEQRGPVWLGHDLCICVCVHVFCVCVVHERAQSKYT